VVYLWHVIIKDVLLPQMPSRTRAQDGTRTSRGGEETLNLPPIPPTLAKAIAALVNAPADNTCFLLEMAGNQFHQQGGKGQPQGPRDTTYLEFLETRPPLFVKAEEPLEVDEWIQVMEQKFGLIRCTETQKPMFAAHQLRGPASTWWTNFAAVQPSGHLCHVGRIQAGIQGTLYSRRGFTNENGGVYMFKARRRLGDVVSLQVQSSLPVCYRPSGHRSEEELLHERFK
jgi:hypothetical protein